MSEPDVLGEWLRDGYPAAYRTAYLILRNSHDAEEAVQDAFLRAWRFRATVPAGEGTRPWMYRVVVNSCLSRLRSDRSRAKVSSDAAFEEAVREGRAEGSSRSGLDPLPEEAVTSSETQRSVMAAIADLPEHLRVTVVLRYFAQLSEKEIAAVIHRRPGTVKSRLHEAKAILGGDPRIVGEYEQTRASGGTDD